MSEDVLAEQVVAATLEAAAFHEIHPAAKDRFEFVLHPQQIIKRWPSAGRERCQNVNVAVGTEIVAQHRAKESELDESPLSAKRGDCRLVNRNTCGHQSDLSRAQVSLARLARRTLGAITLVSPDWAG